MSIIRELYINQHIVPRPLDVTQGSNARQYQFVFPDWNLPDDIQALIYFRKPSGLEIFNEAIEIDYRNNIVTFQETTQMTIEAGRCNGQIRILKKNTEQVLNSFPFILNVVASPINGSGIESSNELDALNRKLIEAQWIIEEGNRVINKLLGLDPDNDNGCLESLRRAVEEAERIVADIEQRLANGDFDGPPGPQGKPGEVENLDGLKGNVETLNTTVNNHVGNTQVHVNPEDRELLEKIRNGEVGSGSSPNWDSIENKPSQFPPTQHGHQIADIEGLNSRILGGRLEWLPTNAHELFDDPGGTGTTWRVLVPDDGRGRALILTEHVQHTETPFGNTPGFYPMWYSHISWPVEIFPHFSWVSHEMRTAILDYSYYNNTGAEIDRHNRTLGMGIETDRALGSPNSLEGAVPSETDLQRGITRPVVSGSPVGFLLSTSEVNRYFPDGVGREATDINGQPMCWYLRSPGPETDPEEDKRQAMVDETGQIVSTGTQRSPEKGIRVAVWIDTQPRISWEDINHPGTFTPSWHQHDLWEIEGLGQSMWQKERDIWDLQNSVANLNDKMDILYNRVNDLVDGGLPEPSGPPVLELPTGKYWADPETGVEWEVLDPPTAENNYTSLMITKHVHLENNWWEGIDGFTPWVWNSAMCMISCWYWGDSPEGHVIGNVLKSALGRYTFLDINGLADWRQTSECCNPFIGIEVDREFGSDNEPHTAVRTDINTVRAHTKAADVTEHGMTNQPFVLSASEVNNYILSDERAATGYISGNPMGWWTRSPGSQTTPGCCRHMVVDSEGMMRADWALNLNNGFRPAIWVHFPNPDNDS